MDFMLAHLHAHSFTLIHTCTHTSRYVRTLINTKTLLVFAVREDAANPQLELRLVAHEHTGKVPDTLTSSPKEPYTPQDTSGHQTSQLLKQTLYSYNLLKILSHKSKS